MPTETIVDPYADIPESDVNEATPDPLTAVR